MIVWNVHSQIVAFVNFINQKIGLLMIQQSLFLNSSDTKKVVCGNRRRLKLHQHRYRDILRRAMLHIHATKHSRKIDSAGRLLIPMSLRKEYNITDTNDIQIYILEDTESERTFLGIEVDQPKANKIEDVLKTFEYGSIEDLLRDIKEYSQK